MMVTEGLAEWIHQFRSLTEAKLRLGLLSDEQATEWDELRRRLT